MEKLKTYSVLNDTADGAINGDKLHKELEASGDIVNFTGINILGDSIEVFGDSFTEASVDSIVSSHEQVSLDEYKKAAMERFDKRSGELIEQGGHNYNGKVFSLSRNAQINLLGIDSKRDVAGLLPLTLNTKDNLDTEVLNTPTDVSDFFMNALIAKKTILDIATLTLKNPVRAATDKAGVDAVIDNR